jgi:hypothetical protein
MSNESTPNFAAMLVREVADLDWHPLRIISKMDPAAPQPLVSVALYRPLAPKKSCTRSVVTFRQRVWRLAGYEFVSHLPLEPNTIRTTFGRGFGYVSSYRLH